MIRLRVTLDLGSVGTRVVNVDVPELEPTIYDIISCLDVEVRSRAFERGQAIKVDGAPVDLYDKLQREKLESGHFVLSSDLQPRTELLLISMDRYISCPGRLFVPPEPVTVDTLKEQIMRKIKGLPAGKTIDLEFSGKPLPCSIPIDLNGAGLSKLNVRLVDKFEAGLSQSRIEALIAFAEGTEYAPHDEYMKRLIYGVLHCSSREGISGDDFERDKAHLLERLELGDACRLSLSEKLFLDRLKGTFENIAHMIRDRLEDAYGPEMGYKPSALFLTGLSNFLERVDLNKNLSDILKSPDLKFMRLRKEINQLIQSPLKGLNDSFIDAPLDEADRLRLRTEIAAELIESALQKIDFFSMSVPVDEDSMRYLRARIGYLIQLPLSSLDDIFIEAPISDEDRLKLRREICNVIGSSLENLECRSFIDTTLDETERCSLLAEIGKLTESSLPTRIQFLQQAVTPEGLKSSDERRLKRFGDLLIPRPAQAAAAAAGQSAVIDPTAPPSPGTDWCARVRSGSSAAHRAAGGRESPPFS